MTFTFRKKFRSSSFLFQIFERTSSNQGGLGSPANRRHLKETQALHLTPVSSPCGANGMTAAAAAGERVTRLQDEQNGSDYSCAPRRRSCTRGSSRSSLPAQHRWHCPCAIFSVARALSTPPSACGCHLCSGTVVRVPSTSSAALSSCAHTRTRTRPARTVLIECVATQVDIVRECDGWGGGCTTTDRRISGHVETASGTEYWDQTSCNLAWRVLLEIFIVATRIMLSLVGKYE